MIIILNLTKLKKITNFFLFLLIFVNYDFFIYYSI